MKKQKLQFILNYRNDPNETVILSSLDEVIAKFNHDTVEACEDGDTSDVYNHDNWLEAIDEPLGYRSLTIIDVNNIDVNNIGDKYDKLNTPLPIKLMW